MRIALEHAAVHVGAGVALVAVADDVPRLAGDLGGQLPFHPGGETGAAAAAQAAGLHLRDDLRGLQAAQHAAPGPGRRRVAGCLGRLSGSSGAAVAEHDPHLFVGDAVQKVVDDLLAPQGRVDDPRDVGGQDVHVGHARGEKLHGDALVVNAEVEGAHHLHLVLQAAALQVLDQGKLKELRLVAAFPRRVLDEDGGRGGVEDGAAGAAGDDVIVEQPAANEVLLQDEAGRGGVDLAVDHGGHALAGDLDERVSEGIAEGAHPAHLEREAEGAGLLL